MYNKFLNENYNITAFLYHEHYIELYFWNFYMEFLYLY